MRQGLKFRPGLSKEGLGFFSKEYGDCSFERLKPFENRNDMNKQVLEILKSWNKDNFKEKLMNLLAVLTGAYTSI